MWAQNSASKAATDYNGDDDDDDDDDDKDHVEWSQPPSPAWEDSASPYIPSAQPVFYPFSQPASGIRPLTPPSLPQQSDVHSDSWVSADETDSDLDDTLHDIMQGISAVTL